MASSASSSQSYSVLLLGKFSKGSGNHTTASRIRDYLLEAGHQCCLQESDSFCDFISFSEFLTDNHVSCIIGIHGWHAGKLLQGVSVPYCLIFGGTDINEYSRDESNKVVISKAVDKAWILVAFSSSMATKAILLWPQISRKLMFVIPQGVSTKPSAIDNNLDWRSQFGLPNHGYLFVLVAGLRPVKDPLYLLSAFSSWHQSKQSNAHFVLVGPQMDSEYSAHVLNTLKGLHGVSYVNMMSLSDTHRLIAESFALVNSSISEGMSTAILEAMNLGVPVIARDIPGNAAIVADMQTGLLYKNPQDFIDKCELLINDVALRESLVSRARVQVQRDHSVDTEKQRYCDIIHRLVNKNACCCPNAEQINCNNNVEK